MTRDAGSSDYHRVVPNGENSARALFDIETILSDNALSKRLFDAGYFIGDLAHDTGATSKPLKEFGLTDEEMRSGRYQERIHLEDRPTYLALWRRVNEGWEDQLYAEYRIQDNKGAYHWIETHAVVVERAPDGSIGMLIGTDRTIDSRKQAEIFLQEKYELAETLRRTGTVISSDLELSSSLSVGAEKLGAMVSSERCDINAIDDGKCRRLFSLPESGPAPQIDLDPLCEELRESAYPIIKDDLGPGAGFRSWMGVPLRTNDEFLGAVFLWHPTAGFFQGADLYAVTAIAEILAVAIHNNQRFRRAVSELQTDELTGFLTRRSFERGVEELWNSYCERYPTNAIAMMDIDRFKEVNDHYGHIVGDEVIRSFARAIRDSLRHDDLIARYGGEEFVVILPDTSRAVAAKIMERVRRACGSCRFDGVAETITMSIGVTVCKSFEDVRGVIGRADAALYRAKQRGRNRVEIPAVSG